MEIVFYFTSGNSLSIPATEESIQMVQDFLEDDYDYVSIETDDNQIITILVNNITYITYPSE